MPIYAIGWFSAKFAAVRTADYATLLTFPSLKSPQYQAFSASKLPREVEARRAGTSHEARHGKAFEGLLKRYFGK